MRARFNGRARARWLFGETHIRGLRGARFCAEPLYVKNATAPATIFGNHDYARRITCVFDAATAIYELKFAPCIIASEQDAVTFFDALAAPESRTSSTVTAPAMPDNPLPASRS